MKLCFVAMMIGALGTATKTQESGLGKKEIRRRFKTVHVMVSLGSAQASSVFRLVEAPLKLLF